MLKVELRKFKNNYYQWWLVDNNEDVLGFDRLKDLKKHFKNSLKIARDKSVKLIDKDRYLIDVIFL